MFSALTGATRWHDIVFELCHDEAPRKRLPYGNVAHLHIATKKRYNKLKLRKRKPSPKRTVQVDRADLRAAAGAKVGSRLIRRGTNSEGRSGTQPFGQASRVAPSPRARRGVNTGKNGETTKGGTGGKVVVEWWSSGASAVVFVSRLRTHNHPAPIEEYRSTASMIRGSALIDQWRLIALAGFRAIAGENL